MLRKFALGLCLILIAACNSLSQSAPNKISFPETGAVFLVSSVGNDQVTTVLHASEPGYNSQAGGNFARAMVYANQKRSYLLEGPTAATKLTGKLEAIYVRLGNDDPETVKNRVSLLSLEPTKDSRIAVRFSNNVFGGSLKRQVNEVAITKVEVENGHWLKVTPNAALKPGEYGIVFLPKTVTTFADVVYDFSVSQ